MTDKRVPREPKRIVWGDLTPDEQMARNGEYVSAWDYDALRAERDALRAALRELLRAERVCDDGDERLELARKASMKLLARKASMKLLARKASMKLDEEMRARCDAAYREFAAAAEGKFVDGVSHMLLAGYRMGLERAAKVCEASPGDRTPYGCAAAIREMAHD